MAHWRRCKAEARLEGWGSALLTVAQQKRLDRLAGRFLASNEIVFMEHLIGSRRRTARRLRWLLDRARDNGDLYYVSVLPDRREFVHMEYDGP